MSSNGYLIWFLATAVMTVVVMALGIAGAAGVFDRQARARRHAVREETHHLDLPRQRDQSPASATSPAASDRVAAADLAAPSAAQAEPATGQAER